MKNVAFIIIVFMLTVNNSSAHAKGGVWGGGGGGEIIGDQANPWFLQNTKRVAMCAIIDRSAFLLNEPHNEALSKAIFEAVHYWQNEFRKSYVVFPTLSVATQRFELTSVVEAGQGNCPEDTDLTFQFGVITAEQSDWLTKNGHEPGKTAAITVRTDYDSVQMHGRGFIFLAGERGAWALKANPAFPGVQPSQSGPRHISETLKHELGHVFGLQHRGLSRLSVMAIDYVDSFLLAPEESLTEFHTPSYLGIEGPEVIRGGCDSRYSLRFGWQLLLEAPASDHCTEFTYKGDSIEFRTGADTEHMIHRGTLKLIEKSTFEWEDAVRIFVTSDQRALTLPDEGIGAGNAPLLVGPMFKINQRMGTFYNARNQPTAKVDVRFNPSGVGFSRSVFRVEKNGMVYPNLDFEYGPSK